MYTISCWHDIMHALVTLPLLIISASYKIAHKIIDIAICCVLVCMVALLVKKVVFETMAKPQWYKRWNQYTSGCSNNHVFLRRNLQWEYNRGMIHTFTWI